MSDCGLDAEAAQEVAGQLRYRNEYKDPWRPSIVTPCLRVLNLTNNNIGSQGLNDTFGPEDPEYVVRGDFGVVLACAKETFEELYLGGNRIGDDGFRTFLTSLKECRRLKVLDLSYNSLYAVVGDGDSDRVTFESGKLLCESLSNWEELRTLNIADCLEDSGKEAELILNTLLETVPLLETLVLSGCGIHIAQLDLLEKIIVSKEHFRRLDLAYNELDEGDDGVMHLLEVAKGKGCVVVMNEEETEAEEVLLQDKVNMHTNQFSKLPPD